MVCEHGCVAKGSERVVELTPPRFECGVDGQDLTELVRDELSAEVPVAFDRGRARPFRVVVTCPGAGREHDVSVTGQVRYSR
jgi:hypothetical protein